MQYWTFSPLTDLDILEEAPIVFRLNSSPDCQIGVGLRLASLVVNSSQVFNDAILGECLIRRVGRFFHDVSMQD
ncbi:MAG: hypothetical protein O7F71_23675 [Gammaproteobacteria bacterium]|nr:hypothetical protein [Gammaproteobacteria bacterium]